MSADETISRIGQKFTLLGQSEFRDETTLTVERAAIHDVCRYCKQALGFDYLVDISSVDNFGAEPRFEVVYHLYAMERGEHLRLKTSVSEDDLEVPTVSNLWATADWHEREVFDMMGITFAGHPDLRRILMWDGYPFYPLRKDFPLAGKPSDVPDVAFTKAAPLAGGPFVTVPCTGATQEREPRSRE
jgi:NADH-quinone oxidoreductase subunit C